MDQKRPITRGQHHLPQFLLKGFASRSAKKEVFTWLFRKDGGISEANVKGIAKTRDFYGNPNESDIEQRLSEMEDRFAKLVRRLRDGADVDDKRLLCEFVASSQIRTANVRSGVSEAMGSFFEGFGQALTEPKYQAEMAQRAQDGVMKEIADGKLDFLLNLFPPERREQVLAELMPGMKSHLGLLMDQAAREYDQKLPSLTDPEAFRDSQIRLLSENLPPEPRVAHLMQLDWSVVESDQESLILGDVGVIAGSESGELMHILRHDPELESVYLPIAWNRLLLGTRPGIPVASVNAINLASAQLRREFFISAHRSTHAELQSHLGTQATLLPEQEVREIMRQSFESLNKPDGNDEETPKFPESPERKVKR